MTIPANARFLFFLVAALALTSCGMYKEVEVLEVERFDVHEFSADIVSADVVLKVSNPNGYKIKLVDSDIDLKLNGSKMGKLHLREKLVLPRKDTTVQTLRVTADLAAMEGDFLSNTLSLLFKKTALIEADGYVKGRALFIGKKVPIDFEEEIKTEDIKF